MLRVYLSRKKFDQNWLLMVVNLQFLLNNDINLNYKLNLWERKKRVYMYKT